MTKLTALLLAFSLFLFVGCFISRNETPEMPPNIEAFSDPAPAFRTAAFGRPARALANDAAIQRAFTLDFRPLRAEPVSEFEVLSAQDLSTVTADGQGTVVGGGLRRLSDYQTVYFEPAAAAARMQAIRAAQEMWQESGDRLTDNDEPLTVIDWGPREEFSSAIQRPSIFVIFSQPMIPLASLGEQSASSPFVTIYPPVRGVFRWYGTSFLSFEGAEPLQSQQTYTITVAPNAASLSGNRISGERVFSFVTESLSIRSVIPGEEWRTRTNFRFDNNNVPPQAAAHISLLFNYPVESNHINRYLEITTQRGTENPVRRNFTLRQDGEFRVIAEVSGTIDFETQVNITLMQGARSRGGSRGTETARNFSFRTPDSFRAIAHNRRHAFGRYSNIVEINFSHALNRESAIRAVRTEPAMEIDERNIEVFSNMLRVSNLPVTFGDRFTIFIDTNIEDIFGRNLSAPFSAQIVMPNEPPPRGNVRFLDWRPRVMLEAQFPPRYLFEFQNITPNSYYQLTADGNPFLFSADRWNQMRQRDWSEVPRVNISSPQANIRFFEQMDLSPFLNEQGKGFVLFNSNVELLTYDRQRDDTFRTGTRRVQNTFSIQVTDLGLTVRYGFNRAVVLVSSISTGQPVQGARVTLLPNRDVNNTPYLSDIERYAQAYTDSSGLAVLNLSAGTLRNNVDSTNQLPFVMAEKDGDRAIFQPLSHNVWRSGIWTDSPLRAEEIVPLAFMFSDRGLYRPGETLTFRGVDRSRVLGMYMLYEGYFTVSLEEAGFRPERIAVLEGRTTESGSFYGQIEIPEDLLPGSFHLVYRRVSGETEINEVLARVPVTVAFFERLRFQAALSAPPEAVVLGDDINLSLRASYLAGGSLSGATWESAWFHEMAVFRPTGIHARGFVFGPRRAWDSRRFIGSESGVLSGQGTATISQRTDGGRVAGAPYVYQVEARVTDIGSQMVTAHRSVMAHPASFYIGLNRTGGGFVRAGQEFTVNYITVDTSGALITDNRQFLQSGEGARQLRVELIREDWRRVQQRGVSGMLNDEFTLHQVTDSVQMINIQIGGGAIRVRPSSAGSHILRVTSRDREGRTALTEISFFVTGAGGLWNMSNPGEIRLIPDQEMYEAGDTARIMMQSPLPQGLYLITVEREGIFTQEVRHFTESVSVIDIPIARNFVPVVYVTVSSFSVRSGPPTHEYGTPDLDRPDGYFGVTRLNVNPRSMAFSINIETDRRIYRPGEEVTMTLVATRGGVPLPNAELSLMAVDRGVLDLINYRVPDPISHFYADYHFPLLTAGGDSRAMLMDPVTYAILERMGGDSGDSKIEERRDFNPTAVFEPMLITDENGRVTVSFTLPDNLTTYRVTVFGVRGDLFALKESEIAAQNRINVRELVPRRLRERDTAEAGVLITNLDTVSHTVTVRLDIDAALAADAASGMFRNPGHAFVDGAAERRVTVRSGENAVVYFDVAAAMQGNVNLNFTIRSDILNERLIREMIIERPFVMETVTTTGVVSGDSASEGFIIPSFAEYGIGDLSLTLDATRLSLLDSAITFLFNAPFGSLENRSARVMPLIVFHEYLDLLSIQTTVSDPQRIIENELRHWAAVQLSNGGFPFWPTGIRGHFFTSLRIAHAVAEAKARDINIPASLNIQNLVSFLNREFNALQRQERTVRNHVYQSYLQSYMLYVMALLGERVDPSRLAEILARDNVDPSVLAFVGMTYRKIGRPADAQSTAIRLRNLMRPTTRGVDITDPLERSRFSFFGGRIEQIALSLQFFSAQFPHDEINTRLLFTLLENKRAGGGFWANTAVTVRVLSAVDALIRAENLTEIYVDGSVALAGAEILSGLFIGLGAQPVSRTLSFDDDVLSDLERDRMHQLDFRRRGVGSIYYTASLRYAIPSELQNSRDEGLGVFLSIYDVSTGEEITASGIMALQSGRTYRARVRLSSTRDRTFVALRVPVPSGAEILDMAFVTTASFDEVGGVMGDERPRRGGSWLSHQVIMDNEIQYFWDHFNRGETTVSFLFRTPRRGVFPTPPVQAELMFEPEIFGRTRGLIYTIE